MIEIVSNLPVESLVFFLGALGLVLFVAVDRLSQAADILLALLAIRRNGKAAGTKTAKRLLKALPAADLSPGAVINIDEVGQRLCVLDPQLGGRFWRMHDPILGACIQCLPLAGLVLSLSGLIRHGSLAAQSSLLLPTACGVAASFVSALVMMAIHWLDLPSSFAAALYRGESAPPPAPLRRRKFVTLRSQAAPVFLPAAFLVCYCDLTQSLWISTGHTATTGAYAEVDDDLGVEQSDVPPYLEAVLLEQIASLQGAELSMATTSRDGAIERIVERRVLQQRPPAAVVVAIREAPSRSCGDVLEFKTQIAGAITKAVWNRYGQKVVVRFSDDLVRGGSPQKGER